MWRVIVGASGLALFAACSADYVEGKIACEGADDCPSGWVCLPRPTDGASRCYATDESDGSVDDSSVSDGSASDGGVTDSSVDDSGFGEGGSADGGCDGGVEMCDTLDNDCDGQSDEELDCNEPVTCTPGCSADTPVCVMGECVECATDGERRCADSVQTQVCVDNRWQDANVCIGDTGVCTGDGVCAAFRVSGGLVSVSASSGRGGLRLRDHGFEYTSRACATVGNGQMCVTGGFSQ